MNGNRPEIGHRVNIGPVTKNSGRIGFVLTGHLVNIILAIGITLLPDATQELTLIRFCFSLSIVFAFVVLWAHRSNALFFGRTVLLILPGYCAAGVQIYNPDLYYSYYGRSAQYLQLSVLLYAYTNLALAGSEWGLLLGGRTNVETKSPNPLAGNIFFYAPIIPLLFISYYVALMYGASLFEASYASGGGISGIGSAPTIGAILAFCMFGHLMTRSSVPKVMMLVLCLFAFLVWGMLLRGGRQDVLSVLFGFYILYWSFRGRSAPISRLAVFLGAPIIVLAEYFAFLRANILSADFDYVDCFRQFVHFYLNPVDTVNLSTTGAIASTFSNTVFAVNAGLTKLLYGRTYWEYILRTPPEALYPDRPRDYSWIFLDWNLTAGGGFFELAEAYLNFSVVGVFIVPLAISYMISRGFHQFVARKSLLSCFFLFGILSVFLRGGLYQTFAFYRAVMVAMTILATLYLLSALGRGRSGNVRDIRIS